MIDQGKFRHLVHPVTDDTSGLFGKFGNTGALFMLLIDIIQIQQGADVIPLPAEG